MASTTQVYVNTVVMDAGNNAPAGAVRYWLVPGKFTPMLAPFSSGSADYAEMFEWDDGNSQ